MRIGVLMGGISNEREISLKSAGAVAAALSSCDHDIVKIDFSDRKDLVRQVTTAKVDCIFNALHGYFGEDGKIQSILEEFNIPYTGSGALASRLAMDKIASREIFQSRGLNVPPCWIHKRDEPFNARVLQTLPLVIKPPKEGSSLGMTIVDDLNMVSFAIEKAFQFDNQILIEKFIKGREITVGILNNASLPVIEVVPKNRFYDFQAKYTQGMTQYQVPALLSETVYLKAQRDALKAHQALGCRCFSRVDMIVDEMENIVILEVNTIPGFTTTSLLPKAAIASGINFSELCEKIVFSAMQFAQARADLEKHSKKGLQWEELEKH